SVFRAVLGAASALPGFQQSPEEAKPFGVFHPDQNGWGGLGLPKLRKGIVVEQERLHLRFGICTGPMVRNDFNAALRSTLETGTPIKWGSFFDIRCSRRSDQADEMVV